MGWWSRSPGCERRPLGDLIQAGLEVIVVDRLYRFLQDRRLTNHVKDRPQPVLARLEQGQQTEDEPAHPVGVGADDVTKCVSIRKDTDDEAVRREIQGAQADPDRVPSVPQ
jgi:hypothetical protein